MKFGIIETDRFVQIGNLFIYLTEEVDIARFNRIKLRTVYETYLLSNYRLNRAISMSEDIDSKHFPTISMLFTSSHKIFVNVMNYSKSGFVDPKDCNQFGFIPEDYYFSYLDESLFKKVLPLRSRNIDPGAHEFGHVLLHLYVKTEFSRLYNYTSVPIVEGIMVLLNNQYGSKYNIKEDISQNKDIDYKNINLKTIFKFGTKLDRRSVEEGFVYQYMATIVKTIDMKLGDKFNRKDVPLCHNILKYIEDNINITKEKNITYDLRRDGIDIDDIEKELRKELGLE